MKKIAVILAGCGNKDGTEITEAVSLIIALSQLGAKATFFAPNLNVSAKNFLTDENLNEQRNLMLESARISRSEIQDLNNLFVDDFDGLAIPGGKGAAIHLSNWSEKGARCDVLPRLEAILKEFYEQEKPIAAICIAPVLVAKVLGQKKITVTLGFKSEVVSEILKTGARHEDCEAHDFISDRSHKIITTPAYMDPNANPHRVFSGILNMTKELIEMA